MKGARKLLDTFLGIPLRTVVRYGVVHPFICINYDVTIAGAEQALNCKEGAIVVANHVSRFDGPFLASIAWPYARIRPTVWHREYRHWLQWPVMVLFGAVCLGSPKHLPKEERVRRKGKAIEIMRRILSAGRHLLIFAPGSIEDGSKTTITPHLSGVHDLVLAFPEKPVLLVKITGLEHSRFGKLKDAPLFWRLAVHVAILRVDGLSLDGGPAGLNARLERYFNTGVLPQGGNEGGTCRDQQLDTGRTS